MNELVARTVNELVARTVKAVCSVLSRHFYPIQVETDAVLRKNERGTRATRLARQLVLYTLHDICGCSHGEISSAVGISKRNVMRSVSLMRGVWDVWPEHEGLIDDIRLELMREVWDMMC